jgi:hypothetical protein
LERTLGLVLGFAENGLAQTAALYRYRVSAWNGTDSAESAPTSIVQATLLTPVGGPGACTLAWDAPTTNSDGTPLTDLAGYKVYVSQTSGSYGAAAQTITGAPPAATTTCAAVGITTPGTWYTRVTAFDSATTPNESIVSDELPLIFRTDIIAPAPPSGITGTP